MKYLPLLVLFTSHPGKAYLQSWTAKPSPWFSENSLLLTPSYIDGNSLPTQHSQSPILQPQEAGTVPAPHGDAMTSPPEHGIHHRYHESDPPILSTSGQNDEIPPGPAPYLSSDTSSYSFTAVLPQKNSFSFQETDLSPPVQPLPTAPSSIDAYPTSYQNSNIWTTNAPQASYPFILSPYQNQGASNYYLVAVPKPRNDASNTSLSVAVETTTSRSLNNHQIEIIKSIELPFGKMGHTTERANTHTTERANTHTTERINAHTTERVNTHTTERSNSLPKEPKKVHTETNNLHKEKVTVENKKTKRSEGDQTASTSLFRPETIQGFRALFQKVEPFMRDKNITITDNEQMIADKNLTGPVFYTKSPINIYVQDPGLVNVMHAGSLANQNTGQRFGENSNGYQYPVPTRNNHGNSYKSRK